jgi:hypothetical protein
VESVVFGKVGHELVNAPLWEISLVLDLL